LQKLKAWWSTLAWWKKCLVFAPTLLVALVLVLWGALRDRQPAPIAIPDSSLTPSTSAAVVAAVAEQAIAAERIEVAQQKQEATDAKEAINSADSFAGVDAVLYGKRN
jgi:hypothetical protein